AQIEQVYRERLTRTDLLEPTRSQTAFEVLVLQQSVEDEALRREREHPAAVAAELEQRAGVRSEQHRREVVEQHRDRGGALDLGEGVTGGRDQVLRVVETRAQEAGEDLAVEVAPAYEAWMARLEGAVVDHDAVVERHRAPRDHGLVVVVVALTAVGREPRVPDDGQRGAVARRAPALVGVERGIEQRAKFGVGQEIGHRPALLDYLDVLAGGARAARRFAAPGLRESQQGEREGAREVVVEREVTRADDTEDPAHGPSPSNLAQVWSAVSALCDHAHRVEE